MPRRDGLFRLPGHGSVEAATIRDLLDALDAAHSGLIAFDRAIRNGAVLRFVDGVFEPGFSPGSSGSYWRGVADSLVQEDELLIVASVELGSPGFWAVVGALNPLEQIRKYLIDREDRRQMRLRETEDVRRLKLENEAREIAILREKLALARQYGVPDEIATVLLRQLVGRPLEKLGEAQDRGVINAVESSVERVADG
jgi:hypothetical protein